MSPPGGLTTLEDQPITWSALNRIPSGRAKHTWSAAWPGVNTASMPATLVAVMDRDVGREALGPRCGASHGRRPGRRLQRRHGAKMVAMRVAEQDAHDRAGREPQDVGHVRRLVRARVQHGDAVGLLDQVGVGAVIGHAARIVRDDAADARADRLQHAALGHGLGQEGHIHHSGFGGHADRARRVAGAQAMRRRRLPRLHLQRRAGEGGAAAAEGEAAQRRQLGRQHRHPGRLQRPVHDQPGIAFLLAHVIRVVVDAVAVPGQRGVAEQQHRVGMHLARRGGVDRGGRVAGLDGLALGAAIDDVLLLRDRRAGGPAMSCRTVTNTSRPDPPSFSVDGQDRAGAGRPPRRMQRRVEVQAAARPHAPRQVVHRRQEAAALRMAVRAEAAGRHPVREQHPMPERRQRLRRLRHAPAWRPARAPDGARPCRSGSRCARHSRRTRSFRRRLPRRRAPGRAGRGRGGGRGGRGR